MSGIESCTNLNFSHKAAKFFSKKQKIWDKIRISKFSIFVTSIVLNFFEKIALRNDTYTYMHAY